MPSTSRSRRKRKSRGRSSNRNSRNSTRSPTRNSAKTTVSVQTQSDKLPDTVVGATGIDDSVLLPTGPDSDIGVDKLLETVQSQLEEIEEQASTSKDTNNLTVAASCSSAGQQSKKKKGKMGTGEEEEKLNNLCSLLDRLGRQYSASSLVSSNNSVPSTPDKKVTKDTNEIDTTKSAKSKSIQEQQNPNTSNKENELSKTSSDKENELSKTSSDKENELSKTSDKESNLNTDDKAALKKANKEAKKQAKSQRKNAKTDKTKSDNLPATSDTTPSDKPIPDTGDSKLMENLKIKQDDKKDIQQDAAKNDTTISQQPTSVNVKSKADLKKERREKQEAQRDAKSQQQQQKSVVVSAKINETSATTIAVTTTTTDPLAKSKTNTIQANIKIRVKKGVSTETRRIPLLSHLPQQTTDTSDISVNHEAIHPAIKSIGLKMKTHVLDGCNARVVATLTGIRRLITDYKTPESCDLSRDLADKLAPNIKFLNKCRLTPLPMDNAIRFVKREINNIEPSVPETQAKERLCAAIDEYIRDNIKLAAATITVHAADMMDNGDVILTYGFSLLVYEVIQAIVRSGSKVSVVVVDAPHPSTGLAMLSKLEQIGVPTHYTILPDLPHIIHKVTKVMVEAEGVLLNGAIVGKCGTAELFLVAAHHGAPIIVLSQTYKFCNIDLTDSLVINELGETDSMINCPSRVNKNLLADCRNNRWLNIINLVFDVAPAHLVTALATERGVLPTSAVPVIIKRNFADILGHD